MGTGREAEALSIGLANKFREDAIAANRNRAGTKEGRSDLDSPPPDRESDDGSLLDVASCGLEPELTSLQSPDYEFSAGQPEA